MGYLAAIPPKMEIILFLATVNERKQGIERKHFQNPAQYLLVFEMRGKCVFSCIDEEACVAYVWCPAVSNLSALQTGRVSGSCG